MDMIVSVSIVNDDNSIDTILARSQMVRVSKTMF